MSIKRINIALTLLGVGFISMGNQGCKQQDVTTQRQMKKLIEFHDMRAQPLNLGAAGQFDFHWVVNSQIYTALASTNAFTFKYQPGVVSMPTTAADGSVVSKTSLDISSANMGLQGKELATYQNWLQKNSGSPAQFSTEASCMINLPQLDLDGAINSFEMVGGGGINIGYSPAGVTTNLSGQAQIQISSAQLDMTMNAYDPLSTVLRASTTIDQKQTKTNLNFLLSFLPFTAGFNYYYTTPLATVVQRALNKAVGNIASLTGDPSKPENEWHTRMLQDIDPEVAIIGGNNMGIKVGDQLAIYNDLHAWSGEPCNSEYIGGASIQPAAIVQVVGVGDELSYATIMEPRNQDPVPGAKVKMYKTVETLQAEAAAAKNGKK